MNAAPLGLRTGLRAIGFLLVGVLSSAAQVVNPAQNQKPPAEQERREEGLRSWELPPTVVTAERSSLLREEDRIGPYGQPRWTATRLFPSTRVYVIPPGQFEVEHWTRVKAPRTGPATVETMYEAEVGLPGRWQLDFYYVTAKTGSEGPVEPAEQKFEVRYALADWGKLPGNPTLYFEWVEVSGGPDVAESKLLLGDELTSGWHWGSNLVWEHEVSGDLTNEYELTLGISHTLRDEKLSIGGEMKAALVDIHSDRGDFDRELEIGPSLRYRPVPAMHIDFAPLIGIGPDSRAADIFLVLGWEF
jgi:hypothetical protein